MGIVHGSPVRVSSGTSGTGIVHGSRTKCTKVAGTGRDVIRSLPKCRVRYGCLFPFQYPYPYPHSGI